MFTAPLHNNGSFSIFACVFVATGLCLPSRRLAVNVYFNFAIAAFGRHVTVHTYIYIYIHMYEHTYTSMHA
jgi:hypothetical protein